MAVDSSGNVYVADENNSTVRKVTPAGVVTTLAGLAGNWASADGTGSAARFDGPSGIAVDGVGNVYVSDSGNCTVRKITPEGLVTTLAGLAGNPGSADGTGSAARFHAPWGLCLDMTGNLYVADCGNYTIRLITPAGVVLTLAGLAGAFGSADGTGSAARFYGPLGVAPDGMGNVYVADTYNATIRQITPGGVVTTLAGIAGSWGGGDGVGGAAQFADPTGVVVDSVGNVYVADAGNHRISKGVALAPTGPPQFLVQPRSQSVAPGTNAIFSVAASGSPPLSYQWLEGTNLLPEATNATLVLSNLQPAQAGDYFVVVSNTFGSITSAPAATLTVLEFTPVLEWASPAPITYGAALTYGQLNAWANVAGSFAYSPTNGAVLNAGTNLLSVIFTPSNTVTFSAASGTVALVVLPAPLSVYANNVTRPYGATNPPLTGIIAGLTNGDNITATYSCAATPASPAGTYPIVPSLADPNNRLVNYAVTVNNGALTVTAHQTEGSLVYAFTNFAGLPGVPGSADGTGSAARFEFPYGVAVDSSGNVYVADSGNDTIRQITPTGVVTTLAGLAGNQGSADGMGSAARFNLPTGVAVDNSGNVYVADYNNFTIRKVTPAGVVTTLAGFAGSWGGADGTGSDARFNQPSGVAVDSQGNVYVADDFNFTIRKITPAGVASTLAGLPGIRGSSDGTGSAARFLYPFGVAVDSGGYLYVADSSNDTIRQITPGGLVTTLAGSPGLGGSADGTGSAARFNLPYAVAVDSSGNVYVADWNNITVRKVTPAGVATTLAGLAGYPGSADGTGGAARFRAPTGVAVDSAGNVYVADCNNHRISKGVPLAVPQPPQVLVQPQSLTMAAGGSVGFLVEVTGSAPFSYQWQFGGVDLADGGQFSGTTSRTSMLASSRPPMPGLIR